MGTKLLIFSFIVLFLFTLQGEETLIFDYPTGPGLRSGIYYYLKGASPYTVNGENIKAVDHSGLFALLRGEEKLYVMVFGIDVQPPPNNSVGVGEYHSGEDWRLLRLFPDNKRKDFEVNKSSGELGKGIPWGSMGGGLLVEYSYGEPVYAVADGKVVRSFKGGPCWVNVIVIEHKSAGKIYYSVYEHLRERIVTTGQKVHRGEIIATIGDPSCAGPHLHIEIRNEKRAGEAYDPAEVVVGDGYLPDLNIDPRGADSGHHQVPALFIYNHRAGGSEISGMEILPGKKVSVKGRLLGLPEKVLLLEKEFHMNFTLTETEQRPVEWAALEVVVFEKKGKEFKFVTVIRREENVYLKGGERKSFSLAGLLPHDLNPSAEYYLRIRGREYQERGKWVYFWEKRFVAGSASLDAAS